MNKKPRFKKRIREAVNSQVFVDYSGEKPTIKFKVPQLSAQRKNYINKGIYFCFLFSMLFALSFIVFFDLLISYNIHKNNLNINLTECKIFNGDVISCADYSNHAYNVSLKNYYSEYEFLGVNITKTGQHIDVGKIDYDTCNIILLASLIILSFLISFQFRKKIGYLIMRNDGDKAKPNYRWIFNPSDVFKKEGKWICEIPGFSNVYLDYDTDGDFQKYLLKINITDLPVYEIIEKKIKCRSKRKNKNKKIKIRFKKSVFHWKAEFVFSKKPLNGKMVCHFD